MKLALVLSLAWLGALACAQEPVRVVAAGDIACDTEMVDTQIYGLCDSDVTADLIGALAPDAVLPLGDIQYESAELDQFMAVYDTTWGRFKDISYPTLGNHEYYGDLSGYFDYFGERAGERGRGYYAAELGDWLLVSLNSNCAHVDCGAASEQAVWLEQTLSEHPGRCVLTIWHHPRFSSGRHGPHDALGDLWAVLDAYGADLVLSGHDHHFERFAPQDAGGNVQVSGLRQFVVGTGGRSFYGVNEVGANSEAVVENVFGVLELSLLADTYSWRFVTPQGVLDEGAAECR